MLAGRPCPKHEWGNPVAKPPPSMLRRREGCGQCTLVEEKWRTLLRKIHGSVIRGKSPDAMTHLYFFVAELFQDVSTQTRHFPRDAFHQLRVQLDCRNTYPYESASRAA